jgi:peptidoglycan/LPS O-acetylase OafA/YrhL
MINRQKLTKLSLFLCKGNNIWIPILFIVLSEILLRPFFPGTLALIMDWANDVIYLSIYGYGFVYASDKKIQERVSRLKGISGVVAILVTILYIIMDYLWLTKGTWVVYSKYLWAVTKGFYECSAIIFVIWLGKNYLNRNSFVLSYLGKGSFTYYLLHYIPVSMFTYYFIKQDINIYIKYLLVLLLSYLFIFILYEVLIRRLFSLGSRKLVKPGEKSL